MAVRSRHPFHLVDSSPWPILGALFALGLTTGSVSLFQYSTPSFGAASMVGLCLVRAQWWRDVSREASSLGDHSQVVELGIRWGMILFIVSEAFFFLSFF